MQWRFLVALHAENCENDVCGELFFFVAKNAVNQVRPFVELFVHNRIWRLAVEQLFAVYRSFECDHHQQLLVVDFWIGVVQRIYSVAQFARAFAKVEFVVAIDVGAESVSSHMKRYGSFFVCWHRCYQSLSSSKQSSIFCMRFVMRR